MSTVEPGSGVVCVTGASGFVGTHVVHAMLRRGHRVRATVRDPDDTKKCAHLLALDGADERLELVPGDLLTEGSFDRAVEGCAAVVHTAAVALLTAKDPQRQIVDPSVRGVTNVLGSVRRAGGVKVFVQTSSMAAMVSTPVAGKRYQEGDWNEEAKLHNDPYGLAKTLAERAVWRFAEEDGAPRCVAINPALVLGPLYVKAHVRSSPSVLRDLLVGTFPAIPRFQFGVVDGREVGDAHALGVERDVMGRFLLVAEPLWLREIADVLRPHYPDRKITKRQLPNFLMYVASLFDKRVDRTMLDQLLDKTIGFDNTRSRDVLGVDYRPAERTVLDTAASMIGRGFA
ncbi:MAG: NAD-dependent epimerase/dehydratase family protein [Sandaracinaceae bacterium]